MTVEVLRLSGLQDGDADQVAGALLDDQRAHPDLSRLVVIDDTAALIGHAAVYERLLTSRRLDHLLCVAVGPRAGHSKEFRFPGNISGAQGSALLWVSDPYGIDWRLAASAIAVGHSGNSASGLDHLVELLSVDEVFDRVCEIARHVPGGVASPGIRLAGAGDEAASFAAAFVMVIRRLTTREPGLVAGADEPFKALLGAQAGTVNLTEHGELSRCREDVAVSCAAATDAATRWAGVSGMLGFGPPDVRDHVIKTATALGVFRDRAASLMRDAHAPGGLTEKQRDRLTAAGVRLPAPPAAIPGGGQDTEAPGTGSGRSAVSRAIAEAVRGGDPLPRVTRRLNLTASALHHGGSASYLPEVDQACPPELLRELAGPPAPPRQPRWWLPAAGALAAALGTLVAVGWNAAAGAAVGVIAFAIMMTAAVWSWRVRFSAWRRQLALDEALHSAGALADLITAVAAKEWSGGSATSEEITRARIALDGVAKRLTEHADAVGDSGRGPQAARLSESLMPGLCDLVIVALAAGSASDGGQAAFEQARAKTTELITDWTEYARKHGALTPPPFAIVATNDVSYADQGEMAEITEAVQHDPHDVMWQLCSAADLSALDVTGMPQVVAFAPRMTRQPLADVLPPDTVWTSSGEHAGLLRLVPLRAGIASTSWKTDERRPGLPL
jgi:hypothetical protein